jgi:Flp pilus assembly protein TadD
MPPPGLTPAVIEAVTLQQQGRVSDAERIYRAVLKTEPANFYALHQLAVILLERKDNADALALLAAAVEQRPDSAEALSNLGLALHALGNFEQSVSAYDHALAANPRHAVAWWNRADSLQELGRFAEALACCDRAIALTPESRSAHYNRANALRELGRAQEALVAYAQATQIDPAFADAHFNEALVRLREGDFAGGWPKYEWRWKRNDNPQADRFSAPQWDGATPLNGRTILLHAEQGLGDTIQFARYVPMVAARGASIVMEVQGALAPLLAPSPGVHVVAAGQALPPFDSHCALMSLPLAFGTDLTSIPGGVPYLHVPAERIEAWSRRLPPAQGLRVGLCWSGNPNHQSDRERSISLERLTPLLSAPGVQFVGVQKDLRESDRAVLSHFPLLGLGQQFEDFADTAAVLSLCDLVISVDTSVAHLAGALGRPLWLLIQYMPDFRWLMEREDSPWYPTARLFRQHSRGDWDSVIARLGGELARVQSSSSGSPT